MYKKIDKEKLDFTHKFTAIAASILAIIGALVVAVDWMTSPAPRKSVSLDQMNDGETVEIFRPITEENKPMSVSGLGNGMLISNAPQLTEEVSKPKSTSQGTIPSDQVAQKVNDSSINNDSKLYATVSSVDLVGKIEVDREFNCKSADPLIICLWK